MMVLAVIVAVLLMNLVLSPLMNVLSVKEGASNRKYTPDCSFGTCTPSGTYVNPEGEDTQHQVSSLTSNKNEMAGIRGAQMINV